jgi:hypothetical protein
MTPPTRNQIACIASSATGKPLCDRPDRNPVLFGGLDSAYFSAVTGYGARPCPECVKNAAFAMVEALELS